MLVLWCINSRMLCVLRVCCFLIAGFDREIQREGFALHRFCNLDLWWFHVYGSSISCSIQLNCQVDVNIWCRICVMYFVNILFSSRHFGVYLETFLSIGRFWFGFCCKYICASDWIILEALSAETRKTSINLCIFVTSDNTLTI